MSTAEVFEAITALTPAEKAALLGRLARETTLLESSRDIASPDAPRPVGLAAGEFVVPDDFDAPLPAEVLADFEPK